MAVFTFFGTDLSSGSVPSAPRRTGWGVDCKHSVAPHNWQKQEMT